MPELTYRVKAAKEEGVEVTKVVDKEDLFSRMQHKKYEPQMEINKKEQYYKGWQAAVQFVLTK